MKNKLRSLVLGLLLGAGGIALATTFQFFSPATGILKGASNTYVTTPAAAADVIALWGGTCSSSNVLKGDGTCGSFTSGTVSSVALTMPTGLSVAGSPVTTTGTLAVTTTLNGPVRGNGSGLITGSTSLTSEVSGLLPVANGGSGVGTLTGILKGNGTSPFSIVTSPNVISLWTGTCDSTTYLRGDGACVTPAGGGGGSGTVTSVALTMPTIFTVGGSPVSTAGTFAVTIAGTSGGVPYFSSASQLSSSAALTASALVVGGGAGTAPAALGSLGTTSTVLHGNAAGLPTFGAVANSDLTNSAITINGTSTALGGTRTLTLASADFASQGTSNTVLHGNGGGNPAFSSVSLSADVSGVLPDGNLSANVALYAANMSAFSFGTLADARLSGNVALYGSNMSSFTTGTLLDARLSGNVALYNGSMAGFTSGTLSDARLSANVAMYGSSMAGFTTGALPDARLSANVALYGGSMAGFSAGTLADARLSSNVALLNGGQNFTTAPTITAKAVCLADGTNCPGGGTSTGSFTATITDGVNSTTGTIFYRVTGGFVSLWTTSVISITSANAFLSISGLPSAVRTASGKQFITQVLNNSLSTLAQTAVIRSGDPVAPNVIDFNLSTGSSPTTFTGSFAATGTKGLTAGWSCVYTID